MNDLERDGYSFRKIYSSNIHRAGAAELLAWLETTDFFTAPAGKKHHGAYPGGLVHHSLNVYQKLTEASVDWPLERETYAICGLLHDVCKVNFYVPEPGGGYSVRDRFPFGHGEKSVYLIARYMALTKEEALAIRWHMGAWDEAVRGGSRALDQALALSPLVYALQDADMRAMLEEKREEEAREN